MAAEFRNLSLDARTISLPRPTPTYRSSKMLPSLDFQSRVAALQQVYALKLQQSSINSTWASVLPSHNSSTNPSSSHAPSSFSLKPPVNSLEHSIQTSSNGSLSAENPKLQSLTERGSGSVPVPPNSAFGGRLTTANSAIDTTADLIRRLKLAKAKLALTLQTYELPSIIPTSDTPLPTHSARNATWSDTRLVDIPAHAWTDFCKLILEPLLQQSLENFKNSDQLVKLIARVRPRRPAGNTFTQASEYVNVHARPCLIREAFQNVQSSAEDFYKKPPPKVFFNVDQKGKTTQHEGLLSFTLTETSVTRRATVFARQDRLAEAARVREKNQEQKRIAKSDKVFDEEDEVPWNKELIVITYNHTSVWTGNTVEVVALGFARRVRTKSDGSVSVEALVHEKLSPAPWNNHGIITVQRLCQFSSVVRQSWALSCLLKDVNSPIGAAFLALPFADYQYEQNIYGSEYSSQLNHLNPKQKEVTQNLAWTVTKDDSVKVLGLHGPPGTGKSQVVVALVQMLRAINCDIRILVAATTNTAVDAVGRRIVNILEPTLPKEKNETDDGKKHSSVIYRFGHPDKIADDMLEYASCDLTLQQKHKEWPKKYVFLTTLNGCGSAAVVSAHQSCHFDLIIVDEAGQALQSDTLIPAMILGINKIILIGDPKQLPATVKDRLSEQANYSLSWLERISLQYKNDSDILPMLNVQYRMHPAICQFPSDEFYHSGLLTHKDVLENHVGWKLVPFKFFNVQNSKEQGEWSKYNSAEIKVVEILIKSCARHEADGKNYGVITGYAEQCRRLTSRITTLETLKNVKVSTVDGFQGQENKVIVVSTVRAGTGSIGFLNDRKRVNVALTRAQKSLFIVGCGKTLLLHGLWERLINHAKENGNYVDVSTSSLADPSTMDRLILKETPFDW